MSQPIRVIYASMSGNSEFLAGWVSEEIAKTGVPAEAIYCDAVDLAQLRDIDRAVFVVPTWGRGEVPAGADRIFEALEEEASEALDQLRFGLIAPGDRSYPDFCGGGKLFAERLLERGARQVNEPLCLDGIPMERHFDDVRQWLEEVVPALGGTAATSA